MKLNRTAVAGVLTAILLGQAAPKAATAETLDLGSVRYDLPDGYSTSSHPSSPVNVAKDGINISLARLDYISWWMRTAPQRAVDRGGELVYSVRAGSHTALSNLRVIGRNISDAAKETSSNAESTLRGLRR